MAGFAIGPHSERQGAPTWYLLHDAGAPRLSLESQDLGSWLSSKIIHYDKSEKNRSQVSEMSVMGSVEPEKQFNFAFWRETRA